MRLDWGAEPQFVLAIGGLHPRFAAPAGLPPLERVTFALTGGENPRVRLVTYLALTANTIQLGGQLALHRDDSGYGVEGGGGFDALVRWAPFGLDVAFPAWMRVFAPAGRQLAARVVVDVSGPQPWQVLGLASVEFLGFTAPVAIDFRLGTAGPAQPVDVARLLWAQLTRPGGWQAALGAGTPSGVTLSAADTDQLVVHPLATISVRQRVVPLAGPVSRIGALLPKDGTRRYDLDVSVPGGVRVEPLDELFAPAQYVDVTDDEKLTGAAFQPMPAGVSVRPDRAALAPLDRAVGAGPVVETIDLDLS
jgi:hypothetical protein